MNIATMRPQSLLAFNKERFINLIIILASISLFGISLGLKSYYQEQLRDDLVYKYILGENLLKDSECNREVQTIGDAVTSQKAQYFSHGGRAIVHFFVQMFAGPWGYLSFSIFLAFLGISTIILFIKYTIFNENQKVPLLWVLLIIIFLYLFQVKWMSIAVGMNYLYPIPLMLLTLIIINKSANRTFFNIYISTIFIALSLLIGFLAGWSMECYSVPLSGGIFIYFITNKERVRQLNRYKIILILSLFIGTAILVLAPGNFNRLDSVNPFSIRVLNGVDFLMTTKLFWLMIMSLIIFRICLKSYFNNFIRTNLLDFYILSIALIFGFIANTYPQSFTGISFFSAIILFKTFNYIPFYRVKWGYLVCATFFLLILCGFNQSRIIKWRRITQDMYHTLINQYITSKDGILEKPDIEIPNDVKSYFSSMFIKWELKSIEMAYGTSDKKLVLLNGKDYLAYSDWDKFKASSTQVFDDKLYMGDRYLWFEVSKDIKKDSIRITYYPNIDNSKLIGKIVAIKRKLKNQDIGPITKTYSLDNENAIKTKGVYGFPITDFNIKNVGVIYH